MNLDVQQIEILILEQALRNTIEHENRCRLRMGLAQENLQVAMKATIDKANELEEKRRQYLRRTV